MEQIGKWEVTYTKHVTQKRKIYQDGFLHLLYNYNKVMLYDDCEKLLDSKLLKKDQTLQTGDSFQFPSFLVDIGPSLLLPPFPIPNHSPNKTPNSVRIKTSTNNLSPSHNIIRDFKKRQLVNYTTHHSPSPVSPSSFTEWEALYTTQITQKAKKYHDGFIRLIICGSQARQVALYDSEKTQIDKRFLKKDEVISSGESLKLDGHLVDIGDPLGNKESDAGVKTETSNCNTENKVATGPQLHKLCNENLMTNPQRHNVPTRRNRLRIDNALAIGQAQNNAGALKCGDSSFDGSRMKPTKTPLSHMPPRNVNHILSILKKPASQDNVPIVEKAAVKQCLPQSSEVVQLQNDDKPSEGIAQFDPHLATNKHDSDEAAKRLTADTDCSGDHPKSDTTPDKIATAQANPGYSSNNIESPVNLQGIIFESPNKTKPSVGAAPSNICPPIHLAGSMASVSPGTQKSRSTHQQPCDKLPETNACIKQGTSNPSKKPKTRRLFSGLASMKINRNTVNTEFPIGTLDCPSFDLGI